MLALSNADMEKRLSMPHPLHRRRLRLVIEEQRGPQKGYADNACITHVMCTSQYVCAACVHEEALVCVGL